MQITLFGPNLLVRPLERTQVGLKPIREYKIVTKDGTPASEQNDPFEYGEVVYCSDEVKNIQVGDKITFMASVREAFIPADGEPLMLMRMGDILGKFK